MTYFKILARSRFRPGYRRRLERTCLSNVTCALLNASSVSGIQSKGLPLPYECGEPLSDGDASPYSELVDALEKAAAHVRAALELGECCFIGKYT